MWCLLALPVVAGAISPPSDDATGSAVWFYGQSAPVSIVASSSIPVSGTVTLSETSVEALAAALASLTASASVNATAAAAFDDGLPAGWFPVTLALSVFGFGWWFARVVV
jgi:hypothetical protein